MRRFFTACTLAVLPCALGCHAPADVSPDERDAQDPQAVEARRIVIEGIDDPAAVDSLAGQLEGLAEVHAARVRIRRSDDGTMRAEIELAGFDLPSDEALLEEVRGHEAFGGADVRTEPVTAQALMAGTEDHDGRSEDEIRAEVEDRMRAQGIEGDVEVDVHEDEDGERRVEVRVVKEGDGPPPR